MKKEINELTQIRIEKINKLKKMGISPFLANVSFEDNSKSLFTKYNKFSREELIEKNFTSSLVGRIFAIRGPFIIIKDFYNEAQAYVPKDILPQIKEVILLLDIGDIIWFKGQIIKTKMGVLSIKVKKFKIITKSLKSLPKTFYGLKDVETRYRQRYLDLIMNENVKNIFLTRTKIISALRNYFNNLNYLEVETPILQKTLGGAAAKPFTTYHNSLKMPFYLRIATEIPLKTLLVGGLERVYEIGRIFRNEGIDTTHNPEFTSIEFYEAYSNLEGMMKRTEEVFAYILKILGKKKLILNDKEISLQIPFARLNMVEAISEKLKINFKTISFALALEIAQKNKIKIESYFKLGHIIEELFKKIIEPHIVDPTFVFGYPIETSPLATKNLEDPRFTQRAELFINGQEYANMFTELNDPFDQLKRFKAQVQEKQHGNEEASEIDEDFIEALEYGMPPAGGCGIGIDRMIMLFTNSTSIREVLLFPHLKNKK